ncbi:MAG TPA: aminoglycoside 6-adenylyltransferase [Gaiellaceae bacterium]|nr:aminoglycoside 6-adenylyltransferase [Gaiellaceae bacterium]
MADRLAVTGVLLVGGASERFGSPKALAPFRGETLGERAWRVLGAVCDDVLAVGKAEDGFELRFEVLDDGSDERAAVFGVVAGLRASKHDTCLVLPVDMPLVTPELLRQIAAAGAVPQTGPLPGVYERAMLPGIEARISAGELSLRGVNPTTLGVDEKLLQNVNTRMELIAAAVSEWAQARDDVRAAVLVGSHARTDTRADRWSDLDVILVVDDPDVYAADARWVEEFGVPALTFLEPTAVGDQRERRVLYETGEDVDFPLIPVAALERLDASDNAAALLERGFRVLVDKIELEPRLRALAEERRPQAPTAQRDLTELASDFWYHALWTAKKLRRGEVFTAIDCLDGYMKARLVTLLEWHARATAPEVDVWHAGRFLERWADPGALAALERAYAHYDLRDVARALWETIDLFQGLEEETARRLGLVVEVDHPDLRRRIGEVVRDPRRRTRLSP